MRATRTFLGQIKFLGIGALRQTLQVQHTKEGHRSEKFLKKKKKIFPLPLLVVCLSLYIFFKKADTALFFSSWQYPNLAKLHFRF